MINYILEGNMIRKATIKDIDVIVTIYNKVLDLEERGKASIGWQRGVYPTKDTAISALERNDLFAYEGKEGVVQATAIINHNQMESYAKGNWKVDAREKQIMVLHTLVVDPDCSSRGIGREFVAFYEQHAKEQGCTDLRMDTQAKNHVARNLYQQLGYEEIGIVPCDFNGIQGISLVLLEKEIPTT